MKVRQSGNALSLVYAGSPSMWCQFTKTGEWHKSDELQNAEANLLRVRAYRYLDRTKEVGIDELTVRPFAIEPAVRLTKRMTVAGSLGQDCPSGGPRVRQVAWEVFTTGIEDSLPAASASTSKPSSPSATVRVETSVLQSYQG